MDGPGRCWTVLSARVNGPDELKDKKDRQDEIDALGKKITDLREKLIESDMKLIDFFFCINPLSPF